MSHELRTVTVQVAQERRVWICDHCAGEAVSSSQPGWATLSIRQAEGDLVVKDFCGLDCVRRYVCQ